MLLTKGSGFHGLDSARNQDPKQASRAVLVDDDHIVGDVPRLIVNQDESSFLTAADQSKIDLLLI